MEEDVNIEVHNTYEVDVPNKFTHSIGNTNVEVIASST